MSKCEHAFNLTVPRGVVVIRKCEMLWSSASCLSTRIDSA